jgi:glyoxylase-like metal-dependent hydrolase (beta-lactamase superfamily II)
MMSYKKIILPTLFLLFSSNVNAFELLTEKVTDNVYALVGEIGPRSKENLALNNTLGFVITNKGVLLVGTGATEESARLIESTIKKVTDKPISQIINIGSQDHHWMGNSYFDKKGIPVTALARTAKTQLAHIPDHLRRLDSLKLAHLPEDEIKTASKLIDADEYKFKLGDTAFELRFLGDGHFPNDAILWLPKQKVVFTGDFVFNDRLLGIQPYSKTKPWLETFNKMAEMKPSFVIPGHGHAGTLAKAQKDTGDYLNWLVVEVSKAKEDWEDLGDMVKRLSETTQFDHLKFHEIWNPVNLNRTYLQFEAE